MISLNSVFISRDEIARDIYLVNIFDPGIDFGSAKPGQFVRVKCDGVLLPRPISVYDANQGTVRLIVEKKGDGTKYLVSRKYGDIIQISAPLGNGLDLSPLNDGKQFLIIGGGIGVAPLLFAQKKLGYSADMILCYTNKQRAIINDDVIEKTNNLIFATDDGSYQIKALANEILESCLSGEKRDCYGMILACGPRLMLKAVARIAKEHGIKCQVSLEERMACSVGECKGCVVKLKDGTMATVCHDGPVFDSEEVDWDV